MNNVIITQLKDQSNRMLDWILYHHNEGFDHFLIFDDFSQDGSVEKIQKISQDYNIQITIARTDGVGNVYDTKYLNNSDSYGGDKSVNDRIKRSYTKGNAFIKQLNPNAVTVFLDVDEFIVTDEDKKCTEVISDILNERGVEQLVINSFDIKDDYEVGDWYTTSNGTKLRWDYESTDNSEFALRYKSLIISKYLDDVSHVHYLRPLETNKELFEDGHIYKFRVTDYSRLRLHHFRKPNLRSKIEFVEDLTLIEKMKKIKDKINNKKVCVCIPAGRKKYLEILVKYLLKNTSKIDEIRMWVNTTNEEDLKYIESLPQMNSIFTLDYSANGDINIGSSTAISLFFRNCCDENTIYLRLDDDIVYIEDGFVEEIIKFRIENPRYFLVLGNVINNSVCDYLHKSNGALRTELDFTINASCPIGWSNKELTLEKHNCFFENLESDKLNLYKIENYEWNRRFSINAICWFGSEFKKFNGQVEYGNEEVWLTEGRNNIIFGQKLCCHYSFWVTREFLSETDVLQKYKLISDEI